MDLMVTIRSKAPAGEQFEIVLEKTSTDGGSIRIKSWRSDQDPERDDPTKDDLVNLYEIRSRTGSEIVCRGDVFGPDPVVTCSLRDGSPPAGPSVQVDIVGTLGAAFDGTASYPIAPGEYAKLKRFLTQAAFPAASG